MRNRFIVWFILIGLVVLSLSPKATAQLSEGKLVFSIRKPKPTLDGFKAIAGVIEAHRQEPENWENFYEYNICTLSPDGTDLRQLTANGISRKPQWSPDSTRIAYIAGPKYSQSLWVMTETGEEKTELLKQQLHILDFWWSPNSQAILVTVATRSIVAPVEIWIITVDGESQKPLGMRKWSKGWYHWDAQGEKVKEPRTKLIQALDSVVSWPKWSPDRCYIAFASKGRLSLAEVETVSVTGKWFHQKDEPPCTEIEEWSPDGKRILFHVGYNVCVAMVSKGKIEAVVNLGIANGWDATWSLDGNSVAFVRIPAGDENQEIYVMDIEDSQAVRLTYTNYSHFDLDWR